MSPEKCSYIFYSGNPSKNNRLSLKLFGKQIPYTDSPVFLGIKFDQSLCFNSQVEFIRSRCHDRVNLIKILSHRSWKLNKKTLIGVNFNALIGSIMDYSFFILSRVSQTNIQKLQVIQNTCFKSIYQLPYDTPSIQLSGLLEDQKVDRVESRLRILLKKYIKKSLICINTLITSLIQDYIDVFVESSRSSELKTIPCKVSNELFQWTTVFL
ncbi:RNA-directed DNA polymerase from mobile element jockey [Brachionus plicatilis]|uniref:RNA-directed DNA polymerase from mobile element jockey n=1 Tax=Brachionus plicatilis TaxID=10195 RepID=A0A3M7Q7Q6_BRAPC|nr:RNA-directed DNA polymerase from mobile element jockey [Brachionus plicatilis]